MSAKYNGFDSQSQTGKNFYSFNPKRYFAIFLQALSNKELDSNFTIFYPVITVIVVRMTIVAGLV